MRLIERLLAEPKPPHHLIASNPRLALQRTNRFIFLSALSFTFFPFLTFLLFGIINAIVMSQAFFFPWSFPFPLLSFLFPFGVFSVLIHYGEHIEHWRFAAALGDDRLLAREQPQPHLTLLPMPLTIKISPVAERRLIVSLLSLVIFVFTIWLFFMFVSLMHAVFPWLWPLLLTVCVDALLLFVFILIAQTRQPIEASQDGIRFQTTGTTSAKKISAFMPWQEARLFACYPEPGPWNASPAIIYELSSASHVVYWTLAPRRDLFDALTGQFFSFERNKRQMQALCSLVAAKTGLPLYDLGKGQKLSKTAFREMSQEHIAQHQ